MPVTWALNPASVLLAALRSAPRRYRIPELPADAESAAASGTETALAFAIEAARSAREQGSTPAAGVRELFIERLAQWIRDALAPQGGDPAFQALVLRARDVQVREHVHLSAQGAVDRRTLRTAIDAIAHPGKMRGRPAGPLRDALERLHAVTEAGDWMQLAGALRHVLAQPLGDEDGLRRTLQGLLTHPALHRLERGSGLLQLEAVQRYRALAEQSGPAAGSDAASAQGRASARLGELAEQSTVAALRRIAELLERHDHAVACRVVRSLRPPPGFPGEAGKAKDEWDAALLQGAEPAADILLLAEVKASPAAGTPDLPRLQRGLERLAQAQAQESYAFASAEGEVRIAGAALRRLKPHGRTLPEQVIYCCSAPPETQPQLLAAATKAVLLAEPASLAFALQLAQGARPPNADLAPVWEALTHAPRLRAALHQYDTARAVREAMLHPDDLLEAVARVLAQPARRGM